MVRGNDPTYNDFAILHLYSYSFRDDILCGTGGQPAGVMHAERQIANDQVGG
jgi:hypothetical protein